MSKMTVNADDEVKGKYKNAFSSHFSRLDAWDKKITLSIYNKYEKRDDYRKLARITSYMGDPRLWLPTLVIIGIINLIILDFSMLIAFASAFLQSYTIYFVFKQYFARARPFVSLNDQGVRRLDKTGHGYSFPSGHSHHSTILAGMLILWFMPYHWWIGLMLIILMLIYNIMVPYSRIISGCHYPSDVIFAIIEAYLELMLHWFVTLPIYLSIYNALFEIIF